MSRGQKFLSTLLLLAILIAPASTAFARESFEANFDVWEWVLSLFEGDVSDDGVSDRGASVETVKSGNGPSGEDGGEPPEDPPVPTSDAGMFIEPSG